MRRYKRTVPAQPLFPQLAHNDSPRRGEMRPIHPLAQSIRYRHEIFSHPSKKHPSPKSNNDCTSSQRSYLRRSLPALSSTNIPRPSRFPRQLSPHLRLRLMAFFYDQIAKFVVTPHSVLWKAERGHYGNTDAVTVSHRPLFSGAQRGFVTNFGYAG